MKAVSYAQGKVNFNANAPNPKGDGVLVDIVSAGICGSDLHLLHSGAHSPHVAGHEIAGITPNGKHVAIEPIIPCWECDLCHKGDYHICKNNSEGLGISSNGGMAEQILVPEHCLFELDKKVPLQDGCLVEPLAVSLHGLIKTNTNERHKVAVIGGGTIGLCTVLAAKHLGCHVDLYAKYDHQKEAGLKLGAGELSGQYDRVVDCVANDQTLELSAKTAKPGSWVILLGIPLNGINLPGMRMIMNEIQIFPSIMYSSTNGVRDFSVAAKLISQNTDIGKTIISHRFNLEDAKEAFRIADDKNSGSIKVVFNN